MLRIARIVIPDIPHHVTQRGNNRQDVFFVDDDRRTYLDILRVQSAKWGVEILAYCLMTNHVHFVAIPRAADSLAKLRLSTSRGRPLGSDSFLSKLERLVGRRLRPLAIGRPRKTEQGK